MPKRQPAGESNPNKIRRYALTIEYDGTSFSGFQWQKNAVSIQSVLEQALEKRFGEKRRVEAASRTDSGVHAFDQVVVCELSHPIPAAQLPAALNSALPPAVRVLKAKAVPADWIPRHYTQDKTYEYLIFNRAIYSPLYLNRAWQVVPKLDLAAMQQAARHLLGRHDFSSFRAQGCSSKHPNRWIKVLRISRRGSLLRMQFTADAFLYHMVRNIVGTLVEVGKGALAPSQVKTILAGHDRRLAGPTAPACGLYLKKIRFGRRHGRSGPAEE